MDSVTGSGCARSKLRQLRGGTLEEQAERFIHHGCLRRQGDDRSLRFARASEWLGQLRELPRRNFYCVLVAADLNAVRDFLERDPTLAVRDGGPRN